MESSEEKEGPESLLAKRASYAALAKKGLLVLCLCAAVNVGLVMAVLGKRIANSDSLLTLCVVIQPALGILCFVLSLMARRYKLAVLALFAGGGLAFLAFVGLLADALATP